MSNLPTVSCENDAGAEIHLRGKWIICDACDGTATSSAYLGAFTWDELREQGDEFVNDYFDGRYDQPCEHCDGLGRVVVVDRENNKPDDLEIFDAWSRDLADLAAEEAAERRYCGYM